MVRLNLKVKGTRRAQTEGQGTKQIFYPETLDLPSLMDAFRASNLPAYNP